ncbi:MAG: hypothetical protein KY054_01680 [Candidatus Nealsonbacteria bacterium]|nr:hypothetical protein [Candidatus Nealsonbacteria bacterium]
MFDYNQISSELVKNLPDRTKDVISRRFGLNGPNNSSNFVSSGKIRRESLESIGNDYQITRERVRQIEFDGMTKIKNNTKKYNKVYKKFREKIEDFGGVKKEDLYLSSLGQEKWVNHIFFLLNLDDTFFRFSETKDFHSFWAIDPSHISYAKEVVGSIHNVLDEKNEPLKISHCATISPLSDKPLNSYLEISKHIHQNDEGFFGLKNWPEVNPKGIKDRAYLVLKKEGTPLHFAKVAMAINKSALPQTVHNELIKDERFVLVGRGIYALKEWGYQPGEVKEVITRILQKSKNPLSREEIIQKVSEQRIVKENTILQNLSNRKYFSRNLDGHYIIKES